MDKNILVNINQGYVKHFLVMINSLSLNNPDSNFTVYIMHNNLNDDDKLRISKNINKNIKPEYIYMDNALFKGAPTVKRYPYEIYYRLFAPIFLPESVEKVLYLDSDLIVHKNIDELYNMEFGDSLYIGATQIGKFLQWFNRVRLTVNKSHIYINTGVVLMNIKELRPLVDMKKIFSFIKHNWFRLALYDQDVLFKFFGNRVKLIDKRFYNLSDRHITFNNRHRNREKIDLAWVEKNNYIVHYLGKNKPWKNNYKGILKNYYFKYKVEEEPK